LLRCGRAGTRARASTHATSDHSGDSGLGRRAARVGSGMIDASSASGVRTRITGPPARSVSARRAGIPSLIRDLPRVDSGDEAESMAVLPEHVDRAGAVDKCDDAGETGPQASVRIVAADESDRAAFELAVGRLLRRRVGLRVDDPVEAHLVPLA